MRRNSKRKSIIIIVIVLIVSLGGYYYLAHFNHAHKHEKNEKQLYTCPMHPQIVQDKPGDCPICGMKLVPLKKEEEKTKEKKIMYRSTMNRNEISDKPGKDSMGMEMVPFEVKDDSSDTSPPGLAPISISTEKQRLMGIRFDTIVKKNLYREIRTATKIVPDETRLHKVTTKVNGWVEKLYVNQTGQFVHRGAPLLTIYSPELLSAQQEYLSAIKAEEKFTGSSNSVMIESMKEIRKAARDRLRLLDISEKQIEKIKNTDKFERAVILYSPATGYVTEKTVLQGQKIMANDALMMIVDLSRVWGEADIYETDLPYIKVGMSVEITLSYWPEKIFKGRISFLNPFMNPESRTLTARIEIPNTGLVLKPQMYADARLLYNIGKKIAVPEDAVMRTGVRDYVFIKGKDELIIPYEVKLGLRSSNGYYEVLYGLKVGEKVVTSANFLVDSESSLKAAFKSATEKHQH